MSSLREALELAFSVGREYERDRGPGPGEPRWATVEEALAWTHGEVMARLAAHAGPEPRSCPHEAYRDGCAGCYRASVRT